MPTTSAACPLSRVVHLESSVELLDELSPCRGRLWDPPGEATDWDWVFRGQQDASWPLKPSAFRPGNIAQLDGVSGDPLDQQDQRNREETLVMNFATSVDRQGLFVPGDRPELRNKDLAHKRNDAALFPRVPHRGMYALAQHYGVPTRLLDWSRSGLAAAYFACVDVARRLTAGETRPERFAVWALSRCFVDEIARHWDPQAAIVTVPTATNPNLRAQQGLFTVTGFREEPICDVPPPDIDALFASHQRTETDESGTRFYGGPVLWKFTLPARAARVLLRDLAICGVSAASLFPGHAGAVRAMKEAQWHETPSLRERQGPRE